MESHVQPSEHTETCLNLCFYRQLMVNHAEHVINMIKQVMNVIEHVMINEPL